MKCEKCFDTRNLCSLPYVQKDKYPRITLPQGFKEIRVWFSDLKCIKYTCRSSVWLRCEDSLHVDFNINVDGFHDWVISRKVCS